MTGATIEVKGKEFGNEWIPCTLESILASGSLDESVKKKVAEWFPDADVATGLRVPGIAFRRIAQ